MGEIRQNNNIIFQEGFTLLELLVVIAIIGIAFSSFTGFESLSSKKGYVKAYREIENELITLRNIAAARGTTSRVNLSLAGGIYTLSSFYSAATTGSCNATGAWTAVSTFAVDVPAKFEITGTGIGDLCFQKDSSSTGAVYTISPIDPADSGLGSATITVIMATGYVDVIKN